ncbi:MAG TPA: hypothetical protein PKY82_33590 [Pyrinomonadaceae bacterium]|nr:hypothetical protein [Pyrinomonadaceae bacterium]
MTAARTGNLATLDPQTINWNEPVRPFDARLRHSIEYLQFRARSFNAVAASETVERFVAEQQKYLLFQTYFPDQWKLTRTSLFKPGFYENYSERTNEFFNLVNDHLFPLLEGWYEDPDSDLDSFNIFSLNVDLCCDELEYEYLQVSYVATLLIFSQDEEIWEYLAKNYRLKKKDFPAINQYAFDKIWDLEKTGRTGLYLNVFEVVDHSTGNPWIDIHNCQYSQNYWWSENTIEFLSRSFRESREMLEKTVLLDKLIEASPREILREMIMLWNTGQIPNPENKRRTIRRKEVSQANE